MVSNEHIDLIPYCIHFLKKEKRIRLVTFSSVMTLGLVLLFFFWGKNSAIVIVALMLSVSGLKFLFDTIRLSTPQYDPLIYTLSFFPEKIVWVYAVKVDNMPFGIQLISSGRLALKLDDGTELSLSIPTEDISKILDLLREKLPNATFGFSPEKKQMYIIDPFLLFDDKNEDKSSL